MNRELEYLRSIGWADEEAELTGESLFTSMAEVTRRHAEKLLESGPVAVLHLDPCPRCGGNVIASDTAARCLAGCGWAYPRHAA